ncbi:MAG: hypothetical protein OEW05_00735 [Candidatus Aminicenantes bacterium]|nr:hypothetical protein [Candidatus Aminicenantes bacterium]
MTSSAREPVSGERVSIGFDISVVQNIFFPEKTSSGVKRPLLEERASADHHVDAGAG